MRLFHRTYHADSILREGFRDGEGSYMTDAMLRGVWLSDVPLDVNEGAAGVELLQVEISEAVALHTKLSKKESPIASFSSRLRY